jgi:hypothetical protein
VSRQQEYFLASTILREEKTMFSRSLGKVSGVVLFCLAVGTTASAQYNGGAGGATGTGNMAVAGAPSNYSYGNGKAIGIGVGAAAGAAVGLALYIHHRHVKAESAQAAQSAKTEASVIGCTQSVPNGITLKNENDDLTYTILSSAGTTVQPGQRVELQGAVLNGKSGIHAFSVHQLVDNYGACGSSSVVAEKSTEDKNAFAQK